MSETPWMDAYASILTEVRRSDPDAKDGNVGQIMEARIRKAFEPLLAASRPVPAGSPPPDQQEK